MFDHMNKTDKQILNLTPESTITRGTEEEDQSNHQSHHSWF